ncbi:MAG: hypothetical protein KDD89_06590, partial [Anaerolineales bacterium]|nr:hypothetical protein [Anaerolineales bacterium]
QSAVLAYRVLSSVGRSAEATAVLGAAQTTLSQVAAEITHEPLRERFLQNVVAHRQILMLRSGEH